MSTEVPGGVPSEVTAAARELAARGLVHCADSWPSRDMAWRFANETFACADEIDSLGDRLPDLEVVGEFTVPPPGVVQRPFQALHIDFGLPLGAAVPVDVARYTALYLDTGSPGSGTVTRMVPLVPLFAQRSWPPGRAIADRLERSASAERTVEGILGRIVEIIDETVSLPPLDTPGFLCGMEFAALDDERAFFDLHGLPLADVEQPIVLRPGELLLFDNLATAHGRSGQRHVNELHQLCVGYQSLNPAGQAALLDRTLASFRRVNSGPDGPTMGFSD